MDRDTLRLPGRIRRSASRPRQQYHPGPLGQARQHARQPGQIRQRLPVALPSLPKPADEDALRQLPAGAWKPGVTQDGEPEDDKDVAEITGLMTCAGNWPDGLRWIARRVKPSRRHLRNLTAWEKKTGWKYSVTCTNITDDGISGVTGSHHAQNIDVLHRDHATVETADVRTAKAMGLRNLPSIIFSPTILRSPDLRLCVDHQAAADVSLRRETGAVTSSPIWPTPSFSWL